MISKESRKGILFASLLFIAGCIVSSCSAPTDANGLPIVYPVVTSKDAGFEINGKKVTKITIENDQYTSNNHYMYVISTIPVTAHNSIMIPVQGKGTYPKHITNVEIP